MVELKNERIEQILHEETVKKEDLTTILRGIYTRYMRLYEKYFADIDALNDEKIAELRSFHEETESLIKYYYMDIPLDICMDIDEFEKKYSANLLGADWHKYLFGNYQEFCDAGRNMDKSKEQLKAEFTEKTLAAFYGAMDYIFRDGFGTGSQTAKDFVSEIAGILFGK